MLFFQSVNVPENLINRHTISKILVQTKSHLTKPPLPNLKTIRKQPLFRTTSIQTKSSISDLQNNKDTFKILKHAQMYQQTKQNILNSKFIRKKQKLFEITRQNARLFLKISSQKSLYSQKILQKSYSSNNSLINSRKQNPSLSRELKKSKISECSLKSSKSSNIKQKKLRSSIDQTTTVDITNSNKIPLRKIKQKSVTNFNNQKTEQTNIEAKKQFLNLFNIKQEPSIKERNRPIRIRSTKNFRVKEQFSLGNLKISPKPSQNKIIINQENDIQIHEQVQANTAIKISNKGAQILQDKSSNENIRKQSKMERQKDTRLRRISILIDSKIKKMDDYIKNDTNIKQKIVKKIANHERFSSSNDILNQNVQNLYQISKNIVQSRELKRQNQQRVTIKYNNLLSKINTELNKYSKKTLQNTNTQFKSRIL